MKDIFLNFKNLLSKPFKILPIILENNSIIVMTIILIISSTLIIFDTPSELSDMILSMIIYGTKPRISHEISPLIMSLFQISFLIINIKSSRILLMGNKHKGSIKNYIAIVFKILFFNIILGLVFLPINLSLFDTIFNIGIPERYLSIYDRLKGIILYPLACFLFISLSIQQKIKFIKTIKNFFINFRKIFRTTILYLFCSIIYTMIFIFIFYILSIFGSNLFNSLLCSIIFSLVLILISILNVLLYNMWKKELI